jgi:hypothetical protein
LIRFLRKDPKSFFQFPALGLQYGPIRIGRNTDRFSKQEHAPAEWIGNQKTVPGLKNFFLEAPNATG